MLFIFKFSVLFFSLRVGIFRMNAVNTAKKHSASDKRYKSNTECGLRSPFYTIAGDHSGCLILLPKLFKVNYTLGSNSSADQRSYAREKEDNILIDYHFNKNNKKRQNHNVLSAAFAHAKLNAVDQQKINKHSDKTYPLR